MSQSQHVPVTARVPQTGCCMMGNSALASIWPGFRAAAHRYPARLRPAYRLYLGAAGNSPRCARLRHPAVLISFGLHCSALRPRGEYRQSATFVVPVLGPVAQRRRRAAPKGRFMRQVSEGCVAARVFAASLRREHRSGPAQPAQERVSFPLLPFAWTSKRKGVAQQRETSARSRWERQNLRVRLFWAR